MEQAVRMKSQAGGSPPCVNGNIAIQWEWSNFDPSQKPFPVIDHWVKVANKTANIKVQNHSLYIS